MIDTLGNNISHSVKELLNGGYIIDLAPSNIISKAGITPTLGRKRWIVLNLINGLIIPIAALNFDEVTEIVSCEVIKYKGTAMAQIRIITQ